MAKNNSKVSKLQVLATVLYVVAVGLAFTIPKQCPDNYTQAQVDASSCIVGANIGLPFILLIITGVWLAVMVILNKTTKK